MKKNFRELIVPLFILFACLFTFYAVVYIFNYKVEDNSVEKVKVIEKEKEKEVKEEPYVEPYVNNLPTYRNNYQNNNIMGMIEIPGVFSEVLIAKANDNDYYLNRNLWNQYDGIGAPFFDYRNGDLNNDRQINIYGHNSQNSQILDRLPLSKLMNYTDVNFFNTYKDLYLYTDTQKIHYEILAIKIIQKSNNYHMTIHFYDDQDFIDHTNNLLNGSYNLRQTKIKKTDRILVLQTCNYNPPDTLAIIICKTV